METSPCFVYEEVQDCLSSILDQVVSTQDNFNSIKSEELPVSNELFDELHNEVPLIRTALKRVESCPNLFFSSNFDNEFAGKNGQDQ